MNGTKILEKSDGDIAKKIFFRYIFRCVRLPGGLRNLFFLYFSLFFFVEIDLRLSSKIELNR